MGLSRLSLALAFTLALGPGRAGSEQDPATVLKEGEELLRAGRLAEAESRLQEAVALAPGESRAQYYLGVVRMRLGRPADAVEPLERARDLSASVNPPVLFELGTAYLRLARYEDAAAVLGDASAAVPGDAPFRLQLGYAYYKLLEGEKAEAEFLAVLAQEPENPLARFYLGLAEAGLGKLSEAEESFRLALGARPDFTDARLGLARTLSQADRSAEARAELERVLATSPEGSDAALSAHNELGLIFLRTSDFDSARSHFEAVVAGRSDDRQATYNLWLIYSRLGLSERATEMKARFEASKAKAKENELRSLAVTSSKKKPR
jgi:tetratricopeptide (TPR) repeat protein